MKLARLIGYNEVTDSMTNGSAIPKPPFSIFESTITDTDYEDASSMITWDKSKFLDWSRRRDEISTLFYAEAGAQLENFATMTAEKKLLACKYFLVPYAIRMQIITDSQDTENWDYLLHQTKLSREACVEAMRVKVGQYMRLGQISLAQTQDFYKQVFEYVIWFEQANSPEFKQWLSNEVGSPFEDNGFAQMPYYLEAMKNDLMDIYNGNY